MLKNESYYVLQVGDKPVGQNRHYSFDLAKKEAERLWIKHKEPVTFYNVVGVLDYPANVQPELVMLKAKDQDSVINIDGIKATDIELLVFEMFDYFEVECLSMEEFSASRPQNYILICDNSSRSERFYTFKNTDIKLSTFLLMTVGKHIDKHNYLYNEIMSILVEHKVLTMLQFHHILEKSNDKGENHLYLLYEYLAQKG